MLDVERMMSIELNPVVGALCCYHALSHAHIMFGQPFPVAYKRLTIFSAASLVEAIVHAAAALLIPSGSLRCLLVVGAILHVAYVPWILLFTTSFRRHLADFTTRRVIFDDRLGLVRRGALIVDVVTHALAAFRLAIDSPTRATTIALVVAVGIGLFQLYRRASVCPRRPESARLAALSDCAKMDGLVPSASDANVGRKSSISFCRS